MNLAEILIQWPEVDKLLAVVGTPYCWGAGDLNNVQAIKPSVPSSFPTGSKGGKGLDCSGLAQWALWVMGSVKADAWNDLSADALAYACDGISDADSAVPGDLYFYKNSGASKIHHVTVALGGGLCLHASGGSSTNGDDPTRSVQVVHYRRAGTFLTCGRLKDKFRP